jgi:DNA-binding LytR/AlgR family response regulator
MVDNTTMQCYAKLDEILGQLPEDLFIRTHQSFIVNIYHITEMAENYFCVGPSSINISKKYQKAAKDKYFKYLFTHMNG